MLASTSRLPASRPTPPRPACVCRTVATALQRLRELGWVRCCAERWADGRFVLEQETNAYGLLPESQWRGYRPPPEAPEPEWGRAPIMAHCARPGCPGGGSGGQGASTGQRPQGRPGSRPGTARAGVPGAERLRFSRMHGDAEKHSPESLLHKSEDAGFSAASRRHQAGWM